MACELAQHRQVLCIVNRRKDCRELFHALAGVVDETPVHLSALMCAQHRSEVVAKVKQELGRHGPLRVVSTQLVEAGVDIDFPVVYRAMGGLDSIAQAAGRCNREGRLNAEGRLGRLTVFEPPKPSPVGLLRKGEDACREILKTHTAACLELSPSAFDAYFRRYFDSVNDFGKRTFDDLLVTGARDMEFQLRSAEQWYRVIQNNDQRSIVVWHQSGRENSRDLIQQTEARGLSRELKRRLQRFTVNVPKPVFDDLLSSGALAEISGPEGPTGLVAQAVPGVYDATFGLQFEASAAIADDFVC